MTTRKLEPVTVFWSVDSASLRCADAQRGVVQQIAACVTGRGQTILESISTTFSSPLHQSSTPQSPLQSLLFVLPLPTTIHKKSGRSALTIIENFTPIAEYPITILWSTSGTSRVNRPTRSWKATLPLKSLSSQPLPLRDRDGDSLPLSQHIHVRRQAFHELNMLVDHGVQTPSTCTIVPDQEGPEGFEDVRPDESLPGLLSLV